MLFVFNRLHAKSCLCTAADGRELLVCALLLSSSSSSSDTPLICILIPHQELIGPATSFNTTRAAKRPLIKVKNATN
jgi:hypothetical protein